MFFLALLGATDFYRFRYSPYGVVASGRNFINLNNFPTSLKTFKCHLQILYIFPRQLPRPLGANDFVMFSTSPQNPCFKLISIRLGRCCGWAAYGALFHAFVLEAFGEFTGGSSGKPYMGRGLDTLQAGTQSNAWTHKELARTATPWVITT